MILITQRSRKWPPIQTLPKPEGENIVVIDTKKPMRSHRSQVGE
jgi:hypothetical protein